MLLHPEVQQRAQEELDLVIGNDRLPSIRDRESLPYMEAVFLECLRWHPIAPLGSVLPRISSLDNLTNCPQKESLIG